MTSDTQKKGYYRSPTVCGNQVVFICEDDLWNVPLSGGVARRLSSTKGLVKSPLLSPNGKWIACLSTEEGAKDVYLLSSQGGKLQRLTYLDSVVRIASWSPSSKDILFSSSHQSAHGTVGSELYCVSVQGGAVNKLPFGKAYFFDEFEHQGTRGRLIGRHALSNSSWKHYKGGMRGEIWVSLDDQPFFKIESTHEGNAVSPLYANERIYFLYDAEGIGQIYSCAVDGSDLRAETSQPKYYARALQTDGKTLVYQAGCDLFALNLQSGKQHLIEIEWHEKTYPHHSFFDGSRYVEHLALSQSGQSIAGTCRGKLFMGHVWQGPMPQYGLDEERYRLPTWLCNQSLAVLKQDQLLVFKSQQRSAHKRISLPQGRVQELVASPAKLALVAATNRLELYLIEISKKSYRLLDSSELKEIQDMTFSPDGRWIAYSKSITLERRAIFLLHLEDAHATPIQVTNPIRQDFSPTFDLKGRYLYFLSQREYYPIIEQTHFNASFPYAIKPYLLSLQAESPNPFKKPAPIPGVKESEEETASKKMSIDLEGLEHRIAEFPIHAGRFEQMVALTNKVLLVEYPQDHETFQSQSAPQGTLWVYDLQKNDYEVAAEDVNFVQVTPSGQTALYFYDKDVRLAEAGVIENDAPPLPASAKDYGHEHGWIHLDRFKVCIDFQKEWNQMFQETWQLQKEFFWKKDAPHLDWDSIHQLYADLLPRVSTRAELSDLIWEMQGELGTSHAYEYGGDYEAVPDVSVGKLGADWHYDQASQKYLLHQIYRGDVWNPNEHSPLAEFGVNLQEGDAILSINGQPVKPKTPPEKLLLQQAGQPVDLQIDRQGEVLKFAVIPLHSDRQVRYRHWVHHNQTLVDKLSEGKIGYLHIPDMQRRGIAEFFRAYLVQVEKEALIIDARYNEGGMTSPIILEKLSNRRLGYDFPRWGGAEVYPAHTHKGCLTLLVNEFTGSDGDMFAHSFRELELGEVIGKQTWGGVIGIDSRYRLADGTTVTQPQYAAWFYQGAWSLENKGVVPDTIVDLHPEDTTDAQLQYAIQTTLKSLKNQT